LVVVGVALWGMQANAQTPVSLTEKYMQDEAVFGQPERAMRQNDYQLFRDAYGQGGDLFQQFVRFLFPISGREKRVQFLPQAYWGIKKPRYDQFDWERFESDHFDFYTYPRGQKILQKTIQYFEEEYAHNNEIFGVDNRFEKKIPVVVYQTRRDFEQSSIVDGPIPEGLGGLTELFGWKRVTFPFEGQAYKFEHVAKHEATHVFQIAKKARRLPLWFIEGSAETNSIYWDVDAEMVIRDAFINGFFYNIQELGQIQGTWLMYKIGNFISNLMWEEYGMEGFQKIFEAANEKSFENNLKDSLGIDIEKLNQKVQAKVLELYGPLLKRQDLTASSIKLHDQHRLLDAHGPIYVTGSSVGMRNAIKIHHKDAPHGAKVVAMDRRYNTESLESFQKGAFLTPTHLIYAVKRSRRDEIRMVTYQYDGENKKISLGKSQSYSWPQLEQITDVVMNREGHLVFIGYEKGYANLYRWLPQTDQLQKITQDDAHYSDLTYCEAQDVYAYSKEEARLPTRLWYPRNIYEMTSNFTITPLTQNDGLNQQPDYSDDCQQLMYVSTPHETFDLMLWDRSKKQTQQVTQMRIGLTQPHWFTDGSILFNENKQLVPNLYQAQMPTVKEQIRAKQNIGQEVALSMQSRAQGISSFVENEKNQLSNTPVLDGVYAWQHNLLLRHQDIPYTTESIAYRQEAMLVRTQQGLPSVSKQTVPKQPQYFEWKGQNIKPLRSQTVAVEEVSEANRSFIQSKLQGRDMIEGWTSADGKQIFAMVNNRLANDYKAFEHLPEISLFVYQTQNNQLQELPEGPVERIGQEVQWVSFLHNHYILMVIANDKKGPYQLVLYDQTHQTFQELAADATRFRIAEDRTKLIWKAGDYHLLDFLQNNPKPKKIKLDQGEISALAIMNNANVGFVVRQKTGLTWIAISPKTMAPIGQHFFDLKKQNLKNLTIHPDGYVGVVTHNKEHDQMQFHVWDVRNGQTLATSVQAHSISQPLPQGEYFLLTERYQGAKPSREFFWHLPSASTGSMDPLEDTSMDDQARWYFLEGKRNLVEYDTALSQARLIAPHTMGHTLHQDSLVYSAQTDEHYAIYSRPLDGSESTVLYQQENTHLIRPESFEQGLYYIENKDDAWRLQLEKQNAFEALEVRDIEFEQSRLSIRAYQKSKSMMDQAPDHPSNPFYPTMYTAKPVQNRLKVQSVAAAAAYDGSDIRLLLSGFADNLFGDQGIFINSILLGDTKFAAIGYSNIEQAYNTSLFFNERNGIRNYGLNFTKDFVLDRYRQMSLYSEFEIQDYDPDASARNDFLDPSFDDEYFYLLKEGIIFALDGTVRDLHGPVSGARLYTRGEVGFNIPDASISSWDVNLDARWYNRILPRFGLAHRIVAGTSQGDIPNVYLLGGNMTFRGVGFDDLIGQNYWVWSEDVRIPVFDFFGGKFFDPLDQMLGYLTRFFDVRAGLYSDVGAVWNNNDPHEVDYSIGYFVNVPTIFGLVIRFNKGVLGEDDFGFWIGTNW
jgi:hypothetical protein